MWSILCGIIGITIVIFSEPISRAVHETINYWANDTDIEELRERLIVNNPHRTLIITVAFGLYWLCLALLKVYGEETHSALSLEYLFWGLIFLIFNREIGAFSAYWIWRTREVKYPILWGRVNVIICGLLLLLFSLFA